LLMMTFQTIKADADALLLCLTFVISRQATFSQHKRSFTHDREQNLTKKKKR